MDDYEEKRNNTDGHSSFPFGWATLSAISSRGYDGILEAQVFGEIGDALRHIQESMKMIFIGQDLRKYARFKRLVPPRMRTASGEYVWIDMPNLSNARAITREDAQFYLDFVIDTAIRLQEFDYEEAHS